MQLPGRLGGFELTQRLGAGAMGTVYSAVQTALGRRVVVKTLHPHLMEDPDLIARFHREARHAAGLQHPNTVQVYDFGRDGDIHYIAMEFVDGLDLKEILTLLGPFPPEIVTLVLRDICRGMEAAHRRDLVHRDIKPANLMITRTGVVKVMDFGLARETAESSTLTRHGSVMGSAAYMSPEQAQGMSVDNRTDVFSTGLVGYEIASGIRAFPGDNYAAVLRAVVFDEMVPLEQQCAGLPAELYEVLRSMTVKDLPSRCPSMGVARDQLESLAQRLGLRGEDRILASFVRRADERRGGAPGTGPVGASRSDSPAGDATSLAGTGRGTGAYADDATRLVGGSSGSDAEGTTPSGPGGPSRPEGTGVSLPGGDASRGGDGSRGDDASRGGDGSRGGERGTGAHTGADSRGPAGSQGESRSGADGHRGPGGPGDQGPPGGRGHPSSGGSGGVGQGSGHPGHPGGSGGIGQGPGDPGHPGDSGGQGHPGGPRRRIPRAALWGILAALAIGGGFFVWKATRPGPGPIRVVGACCLEDGTCRLLSESECLEAGGTPERVDVCEPNPCPQPTGACCFPDGQCRILEEAVCANEGGEFQGIDVTCGRADCATPDAVCCLPTGECRVESRSDCQRAGGEFRPNETTCNPNPCPQPEPTGACCRGKECEVTTRSRCEAAGGRYEGDGKTCSPNPCQPRPESAVFRITTAPYMKVAIDGGTFNENLENSFEQRLTFGTHRFRVQNEGMGIDTLFTVNVGRNDPNTIQFDMRDCRCVRKVNR